MLWFFFIGVDFLVFLFFAAAVDIFEKHQNLYYWKEFSEQVFYSKVSVIAHSRTKSGDVADFILVFAVC